MAIEATPVTADDWAISLRESEKRATMREEAKIAQRAAIWRGIGAFFVTAVVVAGVLGLGWFIYDSVQGTREGDIRVEQERTKQVHECVQLNEPLERQYCLIAINNPEPTDG